MEKRDKLKKKLLRQPYNTQLKSYIRKFQNMLRTLARAAKKEYFDKRFRDAEGDRRKEWDVIDEALNKKKNEFEECPLVPELMKRDGLDAVAARKAACGILNGYFTSVGRELASEIVGNSAPRTYLPSTTVPFAFKIPLMTEESFLKVVSQIRGNSAPGPDGISAKLVKKFAHLLATPIIHLCNLSITEAKFPAIFKIARVIPLYKGGTKLEPGNYRPISMLGVVGKILERWVKISLVQYLESNSLLSPFQFGFRESRGVDDALFHLTQKLYSYRDAKLKSSLVFLDLKKAFDSIDRTLLLRRLDEIGISGSSLEWFASYLSERTQFVSIGDSTSEAVPIEYGVIQGSTLGPVLFLIYIDPIASLSSTADIFLFADDTAVLVTGPTWETVLDEMQRLLDRMSGWLLGNFLTLNVSKTKYMLIGGGSVPNFDNLTIHSCTAGVTCGCEQIEKVSKYKYLGVIVDSALLWHQHVSYIYSRLRKFVYLLYHVKPFLTRERLKLVYLSLVQSLLQYGILVWGGAFPSHMQKLIILQKAILKVMLGKPKRYPSEQIYREAKVFTLRQLFIKASVLFYFANPYIVNSPSIHVHSTRFKSHQKVVHPRLNLTLTSRSPQYLIYLIFNSLPIDLKNPNEISRSSYKRLIFTWLIQLGPANADKILKSIYV